MQHANYYELKGSSSSMTYYQNPAGRMSITYNGKNFDGVSVEKTAAGPTASVTIEHAPDSHSEKITLLVPPVNLEEDHAKVTTFAIFTKHRETKAGPGNVRGQVIEYRIEPLSGVAEARVS